MTMKKMICLFGFIGLILFSSAAGFEQEDIGAHSACDICGMDRRTYAHSRMLLEHDDKTTAGTCSIHCTAAQMAAHREKRIIRTLVADYDTKELVDAQKASWVIGGKQAGVMTKRAKWAFREKSAAETFIKDNGGTLGTYHDAMTAAFADMRDDIRSLYMEKGVGQSGVTDIQNHPSCRYCGMDRRMYDYSRMIVEYGGGVQTGTCSIHCTAIDLALNPGKEPKALMVGDYRTKRLIDAGKSYWVIGGNRYGVMSIRGKWAFAEKEDAEEFIRDHGGKIGSFDEALQAAFEDMWEILR
jgi:nitrous oxide reductase accessory protein NosL